MDAAAGAAGEAAPGQPAASTPPPARPTAISRHLTKSRPPKNSRGGLAGHRACAPSSAGMEERMNKVEDIAAIGRQMERIVAEMDALRADVAVLTALVKRLEVSVLAVRRVVRELA